MLPPNEAWRHASEFIHATTFRKPIMEGYAYYGLSKRGVGHAIITVRGDSAAPICEGLKGFPEDIWDNIK